MSVGMRPAVPSAWPRVVAFRAGRDRPLQLFSTTLTVIMASAAIVFVAMAAVVLGMTGEERVANSAWPLRYSPICYAGLDRAVALCALSRSHGKPPMPQRSTTHV